MKVSIITATYNNQATIEQTLTSVSEQTYFDIEHIIVDGLSTDKTIDIVQRFEHVTKIISEKDNGIYYALNKGIKEASGDVIGFLHADDFFSENKIIEEIVEHINASDALYGDLDYISFEDVNKIVRHWKSGNFSASSLKRGWMPSHPTFYVKAKVFAKYGFFDTNFKISADYDFMLRCLSDDLKIEYLPKVLVKMRVGGKSNKNIGSILKKTREDYRAIKKNGVGGFKTLFLKNFLKISQFWKR